MAQVAKLSPCKHEDLSLDSQHQKKSRPVISVLGGRAMRMPGGCCLDSRAESVSSRFSKKACLKSKIGSNERYLCQRLTSTCTHVGVCAHTYAHTDMCTNTINDNNKKETMKVFKSRKLQSLQKMER